MGFKINILTFLINLCLSLKFENIKSVNTVNNSFNNFKSTSNTILDDENINLSKLINSLKKEIQDPFDKADLDFPIFSKYLVSNENNSPPIKKDCNNNMSHTEDSKKYKLDTKFFYQYLNTNDKILKIYKFIKNESIDEKRVKEINSKIIVILVERLERHENKKVKKNVVNILCYYDLNICNKLKNIFVVDFSDFALNFKIMLNNNNFIVNQTFESELGEMIDGMKKYTNFGWYDFKFNN